jgi:hypothetical protein
MRKLRIVGLRAPSGALGELFLQLPLEAPEHLYKLGLDCTIDEVVRNYPIQQPLLWLLQGADR